MAVTNGYCTVVQLREQFSGDPNGSLPEALLERAINATSRGIDVYCGYPLRKFWIDPTVTVRRYRPRDVDVLDVADIGTSTGLIVATDSTGDGTYDTTWASTDYQLEPLDVNLGGAAYAWTRIVAVDRYQFPTAGRRATVQVTAKHGWSAIPPDVEQACILRAAAIFKRREAPAGFFAGGSLGGVDFGPVRITRRDADVAGLLDPYMRLTVGAV